LEKEGKKVLNCGGNEPRHNEKGREGLTRKIGNKESFSTADVGKR